MSPEFVLILQAYTGEQLNKTVIYTLIYRHRRRRHHQHHHFGHLYKYWYVPGKTDFF
jgi:hypothetical protein